MSSALPPNMDVRIEESIPALAADADMNINPTRTIVFIKRLALTW